MTGHPGSHCRSRLSTSCYGQVESSLVESRISLAGAAAPHSPDTLRIYEGLLAILLAGGVPLQPAAWAGDAAFLYVGAYSVMALRRQAGPDDDGTAAGRAEAIERLQMLPPDRFPITSAHAPELISGTEHDRFEFTLGLLFGGLTQQTGSRDENDEL